MVLCTYVRMLIHSWYMATPQVISMAPHHDIWQRIRRRHHGGAIRAYTKSPSPQYGRTSPVYCEHCTRLSLLASVGGGEEKEGEGEEEEGEEGEGWGMSEVTVPRFGDLLDEIDFSTGLQTSTYVCTHFTWTYMYLGCLHRQCVYMYACNAYTVCMYKLGGKSRLPITPLCLHPLWYIHILPCTVYRTYIYTYVYVHVFTILLTSC